MGNGRARNAWQRTPEVHFGEGGIRGKGAGACMCTFIADSVACIPTAFSVAAHSHSEASLGRTLEFQRGEGTIRRKGVGQCTRAFGANFVPCSVTVIDV